MATKKRTKKQKESRGWQRKNAIKTDLMTNDRYIMDEPKLEKLAEAALELEDRLNRMGPPTATFTYEAVCIECLTPMSFMKFEKLSPKELEEIRRHTICLSCCLKKIETEQKKPFGHA
jgi:hypothetical protein